MGLASSGGFRNWLRREEMVGEEEVCARLVVMERAMSEQQRIRFMRTVGATKPS